MRVAKVVAAAMGFAALGVSGATAGDDDRLRFGSVSNLSIGHRDIDATNEGRGQTTEFSSVSAYNIPIWQSFALHIDSVTEFNTNTNGPHDPQQTSAIGAHLSYRVPSKGLIGVFGGYAWTALDNGQDYALSLFGAEAQIYQGNWTFYVQGGFADNTKDDAPGVKLGFNDGWFARGVVRYFATPDTKLEAEVGYAEAKPYVDGFEGKFTSWGVSLDQKMFNAFGFPVYGTVAYRGAYYDGTDAGDHVTEHVVKAGIKVLFGGSKSLLQNDRTGATLDLPMLPIRANSLTENIH
jgi:hypothetical protein